MDIPSTHEKPLPPPLWSRIDWAGSILLIASCKKQMQTKSAGFRGEGFGVKGNPGFAACFHCFAACFHDIHSLFSEQYPAFSFTETGKETPPFHSRTENPIGPCLRIPEEIFQPLKFCKIYPSGLFFSSHWAEKTDILSQNSGKDATEKSPLHSKNSNFSIPAFVSIHAGIFIIPGIRPVPGFSAHCRT